MRKRVWLPLLPLIVLLGGGAAATAFGWRILHAPLTLPAEGTWLEIENGMSLRRVTAELGERGLLPSPWLLTAYARTTGEATRIRAGEYQLPSGTTPLSLLAFGPWCRWPDPRPPTPLPASGTLLRVDSGWSERAWFKKLA